MNYVVGLDNAERVIKFHSAFEDVAINCARIYSKMFRDVAVLGYWLDSRLFIVAVFDGR